MLILVSNLSADLAQKIDTTTLFRNLKSHQTTTLKNPQNIIQQLPVGNNKQSVADEASCEAEVAFHIKRCGNAETVLEAVENWVDNKVPIPVELYYWHRMRQAQRENAHLPRLAEGPAVLFIYS